MAAAALPATTHAFSSILFGQTNDPWWKGTNESGNAPRFECTECGKCCKTTGDVWMNKSELLGAAEALGVTTEEFRREYTRPEKTLGDWAVLKDKDHPTGGRSCIFLGDDGKMCGIYGSRPTQCSTYPFWPRFMETEAAYFGEAASEGDGGKEWTAEDGGCEGISADAPVVDARVVEEQLEMQLAWLRRRPEVPDGWGEEVEETASEGEEIILSRIKAWASDMVVGLNLCPFAKGAMADGHIRYVVTYETDPQAVFDTFMKEAEILRDTGPREISTTILVAPQAFQGDFPTFYEFSQELEDIIEEEDALDHVLVACFHPEHTFAGLDDEDPLHYEKRSPYPVLNLLRSSEVDKLIIEGLTANIADENARTLQQRGYDFLKDLCHKIWNVSVKNL